VFGGAAGTDQDVLLLETLEVGADLVGLHAVFVADLAAEHLHPLISFSIIMATNKFKPYQNLASNLINGFITMILL
jgi:hypothetical protein